MISCNEKIIVSCDLSQKDCLSVGGTQFSSAIKFEVNYREKSPTIATVVTGNDYLVKDDIIICHHNTFYTPSPFYLYGDLFSIPANGKIIFGTITNGEPKPLYGNVFCASVSNNTAIVIEGGSTSFKKGQKVFFRPFANYEIVYVYQGIEKRLIKVHSDQICGILK